MKLHKLNYKLYGEKAILIEWQSNIAEQILQDINRFKNKINTYLKTEISDFVIAYNSLTLIFEDKISDFVSIKESLEKIYKKPSETIKITNFLWEIPVCYDESFGVDLESMSTQLSLSIDEIIRWHSETIYTVFFIGFLPGFLYLGGLDERLHLARKATPRLRVAQGSVAIGGNQTGVYPIESAGGWNLLGNSPIRFFNPENETPCFAKAGDKINFISVNLKDYELIKEQIENGTYKIIKKPLNA